MVMKIDILTLFPEMFDGFLNTSIIKRARELRKVDIKVHNFRDYSLDKHGRVDDYPYGGGAGMVLMCEPIFRAVEDIRTNESIVIMLSPSGQVFKQSMAIDLSKKKHIILLVLILSILTGAGCKQEEKTLFNRNIVVDGQSLPFYESSLTYNAEEVGAIATKLSAVIGSNIPVSLPGNTYIIVNHDGDNLTEDFITEETPSYGEILDLAQNIKENGYLVVDKDSFRVTTIEKEIKALFDGERRVWPDNLDKILEDNRVSYENKDYQAINLYLLKNNIIVWKQMVFEE